MRRIKFSGILEAVDLIPARRLDLEIVNKIKRTCLIVDVSVPADHRVKQEEVEKRDRYLDLVRGLKKLWNIKVKVIKIVIEALVKIPKGFVQGLEELEVRERVESIQTESLLKCQK